MAGKAAPKSKSRRRQRGHGVLPAGFLWRDGRPRWVPSPARRKQGWRGLDLKDAWGNWLARGPAIERAEAIAAAVAAWAAGQAVPPAFAAIAPKGADLAGASSAQLSPRAIGTLLDAYTGNVEARVPSSDKFNRLAPKTQADYRSKLKRFVETLAAVEDPKAPSAAKKVAATRALDIDCLLPPGFGEPGDFELELAYETLREKAGEHMAHGVMACVSAWLAWCVKKKRIWPSNPAELVERQTPDGRIVVYEWPEIVALVKAADEKGLKSIGDAIILAVDLSWSQQDLLAMTRAQVSQDFKVKHRRIKTGVAGNPPLLALGRARMEQIYARHRAEKVQPLAVLVCELTGQAWAADTFRHYFAEVREAAAAALGKTDAAKGAALRAKQFRDLRDTAVTYCNDAGLTVAEICSRTLHSPSRAQEVLSKHYGAIGQAMTDAAADKLDAHFQAMGYTFEA